MNILRTRLQKIISFFEVRKAKEPLNPVAASVSPRNLEAGDHAVQIGHVVGDVYLTKKVQAPDRAEVAGAVRLHLSLPDAERNSIIKWMRKNFETGLIKDLNRADFGLALRYIRKVHQRVNAQGQRNF